MTVFLSEDDGETWPYSLLLDRYISAYPEIYQAPDGRILVSYDKGRYTENSIRLSIFTEEDVKAGYFVSDVSRDKLTVTKLNREYADIVSVNDAYKSVYAYPVGTASSVIRDQLPTTFTVTDSNGAQHELTGTWKRGGGDLFRNVFLRIARNASGFLSAAQGQGRAFRERRRRLRVDGKKRNGASRRFNRSVFAPEEKK